MLFVSKQFFNSLTESPTDIVNVKVIVLTNESEERTLTTIVQINPLSSLENRRQVVNTSPYSSNKSKLRLKVRLLHSKRIHGRQCKSLHCQIYKTSKN